MGKAQHGDLSKKNCIATFLAHYAERKARVQHGSLFFLCMARTCALYTEEQRNSLNAGPSDARLHAGDLTAGQNFDGGNVCANNLVAFVYVQNNCILPARATIMVSPPSCEASFDEGT